MKTLKKPGLKSCSKPAQTLFFHSPAQTTAHIPQPRIDFSYYEISGPDICSLICATYTSYLEAISGLTYLE